MSGATDDGIRVRGTLAAEGGVGTVRVEADVDTAPAEVWAAVTEPARLGGWAGEIRGDLRVGGAYTALLFPSGWEGAGRVVECVPGRRWAVEGAEPGRPLSTNELELTPTATGGTHVVLIQRGMPTTHLAVYGVGVQIHLENLVAHLRGEGPVDPDRFWSALQPQYERLAAAL